LTYAGYKVNVEKHLIPTIGRIPLDQLAPLNVQEMMNGHLAAGLSAKSVAYIHQVLRTVRRGLALRGLFTPPGWEPTPGMLLG
jgi:hypothetical protein